MCVHIEIEWNNSNAHQKKHTQPKWILITNVDAVKLLTEQ